MSASASAILIAVISAGISIATAFGVEISRRRSTADLTRAQAENDRQLERLRDQLSRSRDVDAKAAQSQDVVSRYREPLLLSAYDLQSRFYNILRPGGFQGRRHPEYFRLNTLYLVAQLFGWLEILRREVQFLDLATGQVIQQLMKRLSAVQDVFSSTSRWRDEYYIYRGEQRAMGELMITRSLIDNFAGPQHECLGYAAFVEKMAEPSFAAWFDRLGKGIETLPGRHAPRLRAAQHALVELIDLLDPDGERFPRGRSRLGLGPEI